MAEHQNTTDWTLWDTIVILYMDDGDSQTLYPGYGNTEDDYYFSFSNKNGIFNFYSDDDGTNWGVTSQALHQHLYRYDIAMSGGTSGTTSALAFSFYSTDIVACPDTNV